MDSSGLGGLDLSSIEAALGNMSEAQSRWAFVVSAEYRIAIQTVASLSLISSLVVVLSVGWIRWRHRKYLERLSLRVSGYVAIADALGAVCELLMMNTELMLRQSSDGLRFVLWLSIFSSLVFVILTVGVAVQLHLSALTRVRVGVYMRLERWYAGLALGLAAGLAAVCVAPMRGLYWVPWMHAFSWPTDAWKRRLVLWSCHYVWVAVAIVYAGGVAGVLALVIRRMYRDSAEVISEPRAPEKWDWARLTGSQRASEETLGSVGSGGSTAKPWAGGRGYVMTLVGSDAATGRAVAVRSYVDRQRFCRSVQRLALYPLVPLVTQLGVVACNMTETPSKALYIYGTAMSAATGLFNLIVFLCNPALPDIVAERVARRTNSLTQVFA
ncbi:hypothetical protein H4R23_006378 [Coemansia sp. Cherry 401B]|nr:hypothetical protein IWW52_006475 [Coemansia sp. RSA 2704]KAJ2313741.1 hypothetical protein IWW54_001334 [Coemansia sp. RSA 2705]KAJ2711424.1 hypothetical protein H4R23_006378 [Coemansia sp. Cherry 401B]